MKSACITPSRSVSWGAILLIASGLAEGQSWRQINSGLPVTVEGGLADGANWTQIDAGLPRTPAGASKSLLTHCLCPQSTRSA